MRRIVPVFALIFMLTGCAASTKIMRTGNTNLTLENISMVKAGMTREQVAATIGEPFNLTQSAALGEMWTYMVSEQHVYIPPFFSWDVPRVTKNVSRSFVVTFNQSGIVTDVTQSSTQPNFQSTITNQI